MSNKQKKTKQGLLDLSPSQVNGRAKPSDLEMKERFANCAKFKRHKYATYRLKCDTCGFWDNWPEV